jgi:hypothetical protein
LDLFRLAAISFSSFFLSHSSGYIRIEQITLHLTGRCISLFHNSSSAANVSQTHILEDIVEEQMTKGFLVLPHLSLLGDGSVPAEDLIDPSNP